MCFRSYLSQPAMSVNRILEQLGAGSKVVGYFVLMVLVMLTFNLMKRLFSRLFRAETQQIQNSSEDYSVENSEFESATENSELSVNRPDITSLDLRTGSEDGMSLWAQISLHFKFQQASCHAHPRATTPMPHT